MARSRFGEGKRGSDWADGRNSTQARHIAADAQRRPAQWILTTLVVSLLGCVARGVTQRVFSLTLHCLVVQITSSSRAAVGAPRAHNREARELCFQRPQLPDVTSEVAPPVEQEQFGSPVLLRSEWIPSAAEQRDAAHGSTSLTLSTRADLDMAGPLGARGLHSLTLFLVPCLLVLPRSTWHHR